jgi:hypothetical protein
MDDRDVVALQIGRPPRSRVEVEARCHLGLPVVTRVPPILDDGTPFPTTHWLTCPLATLRVSRLEAAGGVKAADAAIDADPALAAAYGEAMDRYRRQRDAMIPTEWLGPRPNGGVAGSLRGVKCLHAHYADTAAGNDNPIGATTMDRVGALDCAVPCVIDVDGTPIANPEWVEPS